MLRKTAIAGALGLAGTFGVVQNTIATVIVGFNGPFTAAAWTNTFSGTPPGGGVVNTIQTPLSLTIIGGDSGCVIAPCTINRTINTDGFQAISFRWTYHTNDIDGPGFDTFGYLLNGAFTQLSDPGGPLDQ